MLSIFSRSFEKSREEPRYCVQYPELTSATGAAPLVASEGVKSRQTMGWTRNTFRNWGVTLATIVRVGCEPPVTETL